MAEDKNIKDKKPKAEGAAAPAKDAKQEAGGIKKKLKVKIYWCILFFCVLFLTIS